MEMKRGQEWQENKEAIEAAGERGFIGGQAIIVYTEDYFGIFTDREYKTLFTRQNGDSAKSATRRRPRSRPARSPSGRR